jgi:antitoxin (DNA-binding transcriptional repressor) of toxin-antitoxin stability system
MTKIPVEEIERDPRGFVRRLEAGESFLLSRGTRVVAEVQSLVRREGGPRPYGLCAGQFTVPADFDAPLSDGLLTRFEET